MQTCLEADVKQLEADVKLHRIKSLYSSATIDPWDPQIPTGQ